MFIKILIKEYNENKHYYMNVVENRCVRSKVIQTFKAYPRRVNKEQIPYLKAAYAKNKLRLVYYYE